MRPQCRRLPPPSRLPPGTCPAPLAGYPDAILAYLNAPGRKPADLEAWLVSCKALDAGQAGVVQAALQSPKSADLVVTIKDPSSQPPDLKGSLMVYHAGPKGYTLAHKVEGTGMVALLKAGDINADGKADLVWTDTTCGAHTCFSALSVDSWDGKAYQDWMAGGPAMASAEYAFKDAAPGGAGQAIVVHGGIIGSVGAGPQRALTETYVSVSGARYTLQDQVYDKSSCLYHAILDANVAFSKWTSDGFEPAVAAYQTAISDQTLTACWPPVTDELAKLRDFARFRLVVADVASGQADRAATVATQITQPALQGAAKAFLESYKASGSILQACRDTAAFATANPDSWKILADWGYANPSFTAEEMCPLK